MQFQLRWFGLITTRENDSLRMLPRKNTSRLAECHGKITHVITGVTNGLECITEFFSPYQNKHVLADTPKFRHYSAAITVWTSTDLTDL